MDTKRLQGLCRQKISYYQKELETPNISAQYQKIREIQIFEMNWVLKQLES